MANIGLPVSSVVSVSVSMGAKAAAERDFGIALIVGDSAVIDTEERLRLYYGIDAIATDFGVGSPEYACAAAYFSADPTPAKCYVGRWAKADTNGILKARILGTAEQAVGPFKAIAAGAITFVVDGADVALAGINLADVTNLNGVASEINAKLAGKASCVFDGTRFVVTSDSTGSTSKVTCADAGELSKLMGFDADTASIPGGEAESLLEAINRLADLSLDWYGLLVASEADEDALVEVAEYINAAGDSRVMGITTQRTNVLDSTISSDLGSVLKGSGNNRVFTQYSSSSPYAAAAAFGRAFTVNFNGQNTTITLKFKQESGVTPEVLTASQSNVLFDKNTNVFAQYSNDTAILQEGVMSGGWFFDERHGLDWLQNAVQTAVWNLLYTSTTKIPQTDAGVARIVTTIEHVLEQAVNNGLLAPGVWNGDGFGALNSGDTLTAGFYVYAQPVASQTQARREAREAPVIQIAAKLAGAVHFADIIINVNR